jgi:hypothetical protein
MRANDAECTRAGQPMTNVALALTTARKEHLSPMQISLSLSLSLSLAARRCDSVQGALPACQHTHVVVAEITCLTPLRPEPTTWAGLGDSRLSPHRCTLGCVRSLCYCGAVGAVSALVSASVSALVSARSGAWPAAAFTSRAWSRMARVMVSTCQVT